MSVRAEARLPSRRHVLTRGLQWSALALGGSALVAACGEGGSASSKGGSGGYGTLSVRLPWIKNVQFAGEFIADDKGWFRQEHFSSVNIMAGGASATPVETDLVQNKCLVGIDAVPTAGAAVAKGAPLKIIGAQYQKNSFAITSPASAPITEPQQMKGKKIGVQSSNENVWNVFLEVNGIDPGEVTAVPVQFDPTPLTTGEVDGWLSYITNEPNTLKVKGFDTHSFLLADHNYPLVGEVILARTDSLKSDREAIKAFLRADIRGWRYSMANPDTGAQLAVSRYGKALGLDLAEQKLQSRSQNTLLTSADTRKNGLFTVTGSLQEANIKVLALAGITVSAADLFDMSLLAEVYKEDRSLI